MVVHEEDMQTLEERQEGKIGKKDKAKMTVKDKHHMWRVKFLMSLKKAGLETEEVSIIC